MGRQADRPPPRPQHRRLKDEENHEGAKDTKMSLSQAIETVAGVVIDSGLKVNRSLGPGLLESAYEHCLAHELNLRGVKVDRQVSIPVTYEGLQLDVGYRLDMMVEGSVIVEVKTVEALAPIHTAQLLTYLKLTGLRLGLLMNFNVTLFKDGLKRVIH
jgi:GxxExxY protein